MAKLTRAIQKVFGLTATANKISVFGSLKAGAAAFTTDPVVLQSLSNFLQGWEGAQMGTNSPAVEDDNAMKYLITRQLAYLFQEGIAEWDATTTYYADGIVKVGSVLFISINGTGNLNKSPTSEPTYWRPLGTNYRPSLQKTASGVISAAEFGGVIVLDPLSVGNNVVLTLPAAADVLGKTCTFKSSPAISNNPYKCALLSADIIEGATDDGSYGYTFKGEGDTISLYSYYKVDEAMSMYLIV